MSQALVKATSNVVFAIGGMQNGSCINLPDVSCYSIESDIWYVGNPQLNIGRMCASACALKGMIYVFCGKNYKNPHLNSIEAISET